MRHRRGNAWLLMLWPMCVLGVISGCALGSCSDFRNDYSEYRRIDSGGWRYSDTLTFTPVHADSVCAGRLAVALRHDESYPYNELWLEVFSETENAGSRGAVLRRDTLCIVMADSFGSWKGDGIGIFFQLADTLPVILHRSGAPVKVKHIMRVDTLDGICQVGVFFMSEKSGKPFIGARR